MDVSEDILERIRKVKNLAENAGTEGEAQAAICARQNLLSKYNLNAADVDLEKDGGRDETVEQVVVDTTGARTHWRGWLGQVIARNFRCEVFWGGWQGHMKLVFIGLQSDVICAEAAYTAAQQAMLRLKEQYLLDEADRRKNEGYWFEERVSQGMAASKAYIAGFIGGLKEALAENANKMALVLLRDARVESAVHDLGLRHGQRSYARYNEDRAARTAGHDAGAAYGRATRSTKLRPANSGRLNPA